MSAVRDISEEGVFRKPAADTAIKPQTAIFVKVREMIPSESSGNMIACFSSAGCAFRYNMVMDKKPASDFYDDWYRMTGKEWRSIKLHTKLLSFLNSHALRYLYAYRKVQHSADPLRLFRLTLLMGKHKYGLEIDSPNIGKGLYLGHPYNITVCEYAVIGSNCNLNKGVSIQPQSFLKPEEAPVIGDQVWVGINAVIRGKISVGDNVLIAPNTYIDQDIPSNSIVIGNPCTILTDHPDAVTGYIHHVC